MPRGVSKRGQIEGVAVRDMPRLKRLMAETGCGDLLRAAIRMAKGHPNHFGWVSSRDLLVVADLDEEGKRLFTVDVYRRIGGYIEEEG